MKNRNTIFTTILLLLGWFAISPMGQAVLPPPDGGYPGANTAEGQNALFGLTTGGYNTAVGYISLSSNVSGSYNTGVGAGTLAFNASNQNTATGAGALLSNATGFRNTATGAFALLHNNAADNTATGNAALFANTTGSGNTATGNFALVNNDTGSNNTAIGAAALASDTTGFSNTAVGANALSSDTTAVANTAIGAGALANNTTGDGSNIALGAGAGINVTTGDHVICIGANGLDGVSNSCYIGQIFGVASNGGSAVYINPYGQLGTSPSSGRFKEEIKPMDRTSEALFTLKPVTFRYKKEVDPHGIPQFGLVAEDVEKVNPDLVVRDKEGKPYSVRYDAVNAMLLNEFLKEHRKVEKLEAALEAVNKRLKRQDAKIQRVNDQLELRKPASQVVVSSQ